MPRQSVTIDPQDPAISRYYAVMQELDGQRVTSEGSVRRGFAQLLIDAAKVRDWVLVEELSHKATRGGRVIPDGTLRDEWGLPYGYWEAKDSADDLEDEIKKKRGKGYPFNNILFEDTRRAILYQDDERVLTADLSDREQVARLLTQFLRHEIAPFETFSDAVDAFRTTIPEIGLRLKGKIDEAHAGNRQFQAAYATFEDVCRAALNPNISRAAIDEMLIQHMLTERLIKKIFNQSEFTRRNVIASEIAEVIDALTSRTFNRDEFLGSLTRFYEAIEGAAEALAEYDEKQRFINNVYEQFFQGYSVKVADTHGIVYTPIEIVDFMGAAVEEVLKDEFGKDLGEDGVTVLDPCTGTGNFIINLLNRVHPRYLADFYRQRLFANELMLMPYYIASLNIEHEYYTRTGEYIPFDGMCFVDTLDIAKGRQMRLNLFGAPNTARVQRQQEAEINVIIGNPPYNAGQVDENDNNRNRAYPVVDEEIKRTYTADSKATLRNALYDPYVKFFRWAADRLEGRDGVVCYVTNNSYIDGIAFDGMRKHLLQDFTRLYVLDLTGNSRPTGEEGRRQGGSVFGIRVGVAITVAIRSKAHSDRKVFYHRVDDYWTGEQKLTFLKEHVEREGRHNSLNTVKWREITPDERNNWITSEHATEFATLMSIGSKEAKRAVRPEAIFKQYSNGFKSNSDAYVVNFDRRRLLQIAQSMVRDYAAQLKRWQAHTQSEDVSEFVCVDERVLKWIRNTKRHLKRGTSVTFDASKIRVALYRPFSKRSYYFEPVFNEDVYQLPRIFPTPATEAINRVIVVPGIGNRKGFGCFMANSIIALDFAFEKVQCFPFYVYDADGSNRRENITDWALAQFRAHYADESISKWDVFYYVYGVLHHPAYRARYADDLKKDLPRIPFMADFGALAAAGQSLAALHLEYESGPRYKLTWDIKDGAPVDYHVEKMTPLKKRKVETPSGAITVYDALRVNDTLTLRDIPAAAFDYRLGNRSALDWVVEQYRVSTDKRSGIVSDPNRYSDDPGYIVGLVERVVHVSMETARIVATLADIDLTPS